MDIYVIINKPILEKYIQENINLKDTDSIEFIYDNTKTGLKQSYKVKGSFAARQTPFIGMFDGGNIYKGFYSEASDNAIDDFIDYYNNEVWTK